MSTLRTFLEQYRKSGCSRLHMPGHKGTHFSQILRDVCAYDITEIDGADSLFEADSILAESEERASALFQTKETLYSTGGSTLCIQTMLCLALQPGDQIIAARNAHLAFLNTCTLLHIQPIWVLPAYHPNCSISGYLSPSSIAQAIQSNPQAKAVYITSPDYLGCMSDVKAIADLCRAHSIPLLVDNAHGAYLKFLPTDCHPITLGASMCCDSAHKTLPALTGAAYLHIGKNCPVTKAQAKRAMSLFGSTSPSYLILLSLDLCNDYLAQSAAADFAALCTKVAALEQLLDQKGGSMLCCAPKEPTKLTIDCARLGCSGTELAAALREFSVEPEYVSEQHIVLMFSPFNTDLDFDRVRAFLCGLTRRDLTPPPAPAFTLPAVKLSLAQALFSPKEELPLSALYGRIAAENKITCPPGVPIVTAGEMIDQNSINFLQNAGIFSLSVVK